MSVHYINVDLVNQQKMEWQFW